VCLGDPWFDRRTLVLYRLCKPLAEGARSKKGKAEARVNTGSLAPHVRKQTHHDGCWEGNNREST